MKEKKFFYPKQAPQEAVEILKTIREHSQDSPNKRFWAGVIMSGLSNFMLICSSDDTNGIVLVSISEEQNGMESIFASRLKDFIESNKDYARKNILVHSVALFPGDIENCSFWDAISNKQSTSDETFNFLATMSEFSTAMEELPPLVNDSNVATVNRRHIKPTTPRMMKALCRIIRKTIENTVDNVPISCNGNDIPMDVLMNTQDYLPAILIHASINWAPVMHIKGDKPGFRIHLKSNQNFILGYEVIAIEADNIPMLAMPIGEIMRRSFKRNEKGEETFDIMESLTISAAWLSNNNYDARKILMIIN